MTASPSTQAAQRPWLRRIAKLLVLAQVLYPLAGIAPAHAQALTPSPNAPAGQRPIIDAAQNGVPIVHIAPPSAGGVSRNQYSQFNVGSNGLILNNSSANVQTQLGGWISGNMQLGPTPARIILNEVVSSSPSQLKGFIEVAGQRADIVIANPNGISCDGCGFLNTNGRATLTTGAPQFGAQGELTGFNVGQGQINIGSGGLNATNLEQLDLIARGLVIEGEVWAKNLQVVAGANQVLYGTLNATPQAGTGAAPSFAIDIKELGGMYANQIYMVATEQGLGVNSTGRLAALQGNLSLSANGDLTLKDSYAKQDLQLASSGHTTLTGVTQSEGSAQIQTGGTLTQQGVVASSGPLGITAAGVNNTGTLYSAGVLNVAAAQVNDTNGRLISAGELSIAAQGIALSGTQLSTDAKLTLAASAGDMSLANTQVYAGGDIAASASGSIANSGGFVQSGGSIALQAGSVVNRGGTVLASGALRVNASGAIDNAGGKLMGSTAVDLSAASLVNDASSTSQALIASDQGTRITTTGSAGISNRGGVLSGKTELVVATTGGALDNTGGTLVSDNVLRIASGALNNAAGQIVSRALQDTSAALAISAANIDNRQGLIDAGAALQIGSTGAVQNQGGTIQAGTNANAAAGQGGLVLQSASLDNSAGQLLSRDALVLGTGNLVNDARGVIASSAASTAVQSAALSNQGGLIASATGTSISSQALNNTGGEIGSAAALTLSTNGQTLNNSAGRIAAQGPLDLRTGALSNDAGGSIATNGTLAIQATSLSNRDATLSSASDTRVDLGTGALDNRGGNIAAATRLSMNAGAVGNQAGRIVANQSVTVNAGGLDNTGGVLSAADTVSVNSAGAVVNIDGQLSSNGSVRVAASSLDNTRGSVSASTTELRLGTGSLLNTQGQIIGTQSLALQSGAIGNAGGVLATGGGLAIDTTGQDFNNTGGTLQIGGALSIASARLDNTRGAINANAVDLQLGNGTLTNDGGVITSAQALSLRAGQLGNQAGRISGNGSTRIDSLALNNAGGELSSGADLAIATQGQALDNTGGRIASQGALDLRAGTVRNDAAATIASNTTLSVQASALSNRGASIASQGAGSIALGSGALDNAGGSITAGSTLGLAAGVLGNQAGQIVASQSVTAALARLDNTGGTISAANVVAVASAGSIDNTLGRITSNGTVGLTATGLTNAQGTISAQSTSVQLGSGALSNRQGTLVGVQALALQSGAIDNTGGVLATGAALALDTAGQDLDNTGGTVQAVGVLSVSAGRLVNAGGTFSSASTASLLSQSLDNRGGRIVSSQALTLNTQGGSLVNDAGLISSAQSLALDAGALSNLGGVLSSAAASRIGSQALNNSGGEISSGAALSLDTNGQSLTNIGGRITAQAAFDLQAGAVVNDASASQASLIAGNGTLSLRASSLSNRGAGIASVGDADIALGAGALDNTGGTLTTAGKLTLIAGAATNTAAANVGGVISAQGALQATLASLDNTQGQLVAGGASVLATSGALVNDQGRIATNTDLTLTAANLSNRAGQIGATQGGAIGVSGTLNNDAGSVQAGVLSVDSGALSNTAGLIASNTTLALNTHGQSLNNSGGTIQAIASVDLQAGQTGNSGGHVLAGQSLTLTTLTLTNTAGEIASGGSAGITTQGQGLVNDTGRITANTDLAVSAGALSNASAGLIAANRDTTLSVASLANTGSVQAGRDLSLAASGSVVNSGSLSAQRNLGLQSASLNNDAGLLAANGAVGITTGAASNLVGSVQAAAGLSLNATSLDNRGGQFVGSGDTTLALGSGSLDNDGGTIASAQALALMAGSTSNRLGQIVGGSGLVASTQALDNSAGVIGSQAALSLSTQAFTNTGGTLQAQGDLGLSAAAVSNTSGGRILANQALTLAASGVDNTGGTVSAGTQLGLSASGALANSQGRITAGSNAVISAASLSSNAQGLVSAAQALSIDTISGTLNNAGGTLVAANGVLLASGALDNSAGTIASTQGLLTVNTHGHSLTNDGGALQAFGNTTLTTGALSNQAGVVSGQDVSLASTGVNNDNGAIVAKGALVIAAQSLGNRSGLLQSGTALNLTLSGDLDNRGGAVSSNGNASISAANVLNGSGQVTSLGALGIGATQTVDNRGGSIVANSGLTLTATTLNNSGAGSAISAANIGINAGSIDNSAGGSISAQNDASISAASLDNSGGSLSAKGRLSVSATTLANTNGQIVGDGGVTVSTSSSAPGGSIASANSVTLNIAGSYTNTGLLSARNSLSINATDINNSGTLHSDQALSLSAGNVSNSGEISAQSTTVNASGTLTNSGLIDGTGTLVTAGTLNNTGRIYGDALAVGGGSVNNSGSGVIAARDSLSLGATALNNTAGGLIYAINDIAIGGALDAQGGLLGSMQSLLNASSTIEAGRDLSISAATLTNRNDGLTTTQVSNGPTAQPVMLMPSGWTTSYPLSRFIGVGGDTVQFIVYPDVYGKRSTMLPATTDVPGGCSGGDSGECTPGYTIVNYAWNSPAFAQFGVTPVSGPPPAEPGGGCTVTSSGGGDSGDTTTSDVISPACNQWRADSANWNSAFSTALSALGVQINAYNASVNHDNSTIAFEDYTLYNLSSTTTTTQIVTSAPAKLLAGRDLSLSGGVVNNLDSQIVAGRNLFVSGATVNNVATTGTSTTTVSGTAQFSHLDNDCGIFDCDHVRRTDGAVAYNPAPTTTHPDLATVVYLANGANPTGTQNLTGSHASADMRSAGNAASAIAGGVAGAAVNAATGSTQSANQAGRGSSGAGGGSSVQGRSAGVQAVAAQTANIVGVQAGGAGGANASAPQAEQAVNASPGRMTIGTVVRPGGVVAAAAAAPRLAAPVVQRVSANGSGERARDVILTVVPRLSLPTSSLFTIHSAPGAKYLVETDPRFTNGQTFLSSDYFLAQLKLDPERTLTRYGDGFEEQQLINDQVLTLTGRRYLSGYTNTQDEYSALMSAGAAFAKQYQLSPGVALSAEQMALLTTDIVWLTTQTVTLPDGSTREVLVPELYIRRPQAQDLSTGGALMAGSNVFIQTTGDLANKGTIQGDTVTLAAGNDLVNSGTVRGQDVYARAERDLSNLGGSFIGSGDTSTLAFSAGRDIVLQTTTQTSSNDQSTRTNVDRIATVQGGNVSFAAARDFIAQGASVNAAQDLQVAAGRNIDVSAVQGSYQIDVQNLNGRTGLQGRTGYINEASTTQQQSSFTAGNNAVLVAQGDLTLKGSTLTAANDAYLQGANVIVEAAKASSSIDVQTVQRKSYDRAEAVDQTLVGGVITAANNLTVIAAGDPSKGQGNITVTGATLTARDGQAGLKAAGDVTIQAATTEHSTAGESLFQSSTSIGGLYKSSELSQAQRTSQLSQLEASNVNGNSVVIQAGDLDKQSGDIKLIASNITSTGATSLSAGRDVLITSAEQLSSRSEQERSERSVRIGTREMEQSLGIVQQELLRPDPIASKYTPAPALHADANEKANGQAGATQSVASTISADSLSINAGRDVTIRGSAIVATNDINIAAKRDLLITTSQDTQSSSNSRSKNDEGLFTGGESLNNGTRQLSQAASSASSTATSSQVASLSGNVKLSAGETYRQTGSQVLALGQTNPDPTQVSGGDIDISAKNVIIDPARNTSQSADSTYYKQEGASVTLSGPIVSALQSLNAAANNASKTDDSRMQALAAATAAMNAYDAASAVAASKGGADSMGISVDLVHIQNQSKSSSASDQAAGSTVSAQRDLRVTASGAGKDSNLSIEGSDISAGRDATLKADGNITLQAASNSESLRQSNSGQSANIGVTYGGGSQNGLSIHAGASASQGQAVGDEQTWRNTHVAAGNSVNLQSGGDTTLKGAVVAAPSVKAEVGGSLSIQSLQDTSKFDAKQSSAGFSVSLCIPPICYGETVSGSVSAAKTKVNGDFQGVVEQSGIKAGDGGFQVTVKGNTDLKGGAIVSSQAAIDAGKNSFATATLTSSDIGNKDKFDATGFSGSYSSSGSGSGGGTVGFTSKSGDESSVTRSAVSAGRIAITDDKAQQSLTGKGAATAIAKLDTQATTDSATAATLSKAWNGSKLMEQTQVNTQIVSAFNSRAAKAVGDYAASQQRDLQGQADEARKSGDAAKADQLQSEANKWAEGGAYRIAAHVAVGGLAGGVGGALGAGASAAAAPLVADAVNKMDLLDPVRKAVIAVGTTAVSAALGGTAGAVTGFNQVENNFLRHSQAKEMNAALDKCKAQAGGCSMKESDAIFKEYQDKSNDNIAQVQACKFVGDSACVGRLMADAALPGEVTNRQLSSEQEKFLYGRQTNVTLYQSVTGSKVQGNTDAQQAQQVAQFRKSNCADPSSSACDALVLDSIGRGQLAAIKLVGGTLLGAPVLGAAVAGAPAAGAAVVAGIRACAADPALCANAAAIVGADAATMGATGTGALGATVGVKLALMAEQAAADAAATIAARAGKAGQLESAAPKVFNGVELNPALPPPAAGYDYTPAFVKGATTDNQAYAHLTGYQGEVKLANEVAGQGQTVVKWGDKIGTNGSDVISVNPSTGEVVLWDNKYRSATRSIGDSPTFANEGTRDAALTEATAAIRASNLPQSVKDAAMNNLDQLNFTTNTVGLGGAKNSVQVRYCGGKPC